MLQFVRLKTRIVEKEKFMQHLRKYSKKFKLKAQAIDPALVLSKKHVEFAVLHSLDAFKTKRNRAKTLENEILLTLAARRSFDQAVKHFGIKNTRDILLVVIGENMKSFISELGEAYDRTFKPDMKKVIEAYEVQPNSLKNFTLEQVVLERIALAANEK